MRLTDITELHLLANRKFIAVAEGRAVATLVSVIDHDVFTCGWQYQDGYTEDGDAVISECGAFAVGFDNGFACTNGHAHRNDAEYFDAEEIAGARQAGISLPFNARMV